MAAERCANYEINLEMCVCTNEACANRGICCLCLAAHQEGGSLTACLRSARPESTLQLHGSLEDCLRREATALICACGSETCARRAVCCECLRNHWKVDGSGRPACHK
jgi:hypothetical protein